MRSKILFICAAAIFSLCAAVPLALATDSDDDIKPEENEKITFDGKETTAESEEIEAKFPEEAKAVRAALANHLAQVASRDLDGYMNDFASERMRYPELEREYAQRAMALKNLVVELKAMEFAHLNRTSATVHTRQISTYIDDDGKKVIDDAIISYRLISNGNSVWKIAFTERKRLIAQ